MSAGLQSITGLLATVVSASTLGAPELIAPETYEVHTEDEFGTDSDAFMSSKNNKARLS